MNAPVIGDTIDNNCKEDKGNTVDTPCTMRGRCVARAGHVDGSLPLASRNGVPELPRRVCGKDVRSADEGRADIAVGEPSGHGTPPQWADVGGPVTHSWWARCEYSTCYLCMQ